MPDAIIEQDADLGYAVKRNGTVLLRTASDSDWQAMGNGLVLVFGASPQEVDWAAPDSVRAAWRQCVDRWNEALEIVRCRAVEILGEEQA